MTRSANEVMALAAKAARGAGAPPAQAAEFGRAALCHLIAGREGADLRRALDALPAGPILSLPLAFARIIETSNGGTATGIIPRAAELALAQSYAEALPFEQTHAAETKGLSLTVHTTKPVRRSAVARVRLDDGLAAFMSTLAARTFVPESEASRLAGAGAGLTDND